MLLPIHFVFQSFRIIDCRDIYHALITHNSGNRKAAKQRYSDGAYVSPGGSALFAQGKVYTSPSDVSSCSPRTTSPDGRVLHPCGTAAWGVFSDGFSLFEEDLTTPIEMDESRETICFSGDLDLFRNPTESEVIAEEENVFFWLREEWIAKALHMEKPGQFDLRKKTEKTYTVLRVNFSKGIADLHQNLRIQRYVACV